MSLPRRARRREFLLRSLAMFALGLVLGLWPLFAADMPLPRAQSLYRLLVVVLSSPPLIPLALVLGWICRDFLGDRRNGRLAHLALTATSAEEILLSYMRRWLPAYGIFLATQAAGMVCLVLGYWNFEQYGGSLFQIVPQLLLDIVVFEGALAALYGWLATAAAVRLAMEAPSGAFVIGIALAALALFPPAQLTPVQSGNVVAARWEVVILLRYSVATRSAVLFGGWVVGMGALCLVVGRSMLRSAGAALRQIHEASPGAG